VPQPLYAAKITPGDAVGISVAPRGTGAHGMFGHPRVRGGLGVQVLGVRVQGRGLTVEGFELRVQG
jgi:hypothetical protein